MPRPPLISLVIPTHNHAAFLPRAIRSALAQEYPAVEIVVVNDGSTDDTDAAVTPFLDRVRYVKQENRGLAGARNTGIRESTGELLFFLDADDEAMPGALSRLEETLDRLGPGCGLLACLAEVVKWTDGTPSRPPLNPVPADPAPERIHWKDLAFGSRFPCTVLARRRLFEACGGFDESYRRHGCEDRDMWMRAACRFDVFRLPERLVTLHLHGGNMSADPVRQLAGIRKLNAKARAMGQVPRWRLDFWGAIRAGYHYTASLLHEEAGQRGKALLHAGLALAVYPLPGVRRHLRRPPFFRLARLLATGRGLITRPLIA